MKVKYRQRSFFYPLCFAVSVALSAVCFAAWNSGAAGVVSDFVSVAVSPVQYAANKTYEKLCAVGVYFNSVEQLNRENSLLKEENKKLKGLETQNEILRKQNDDLYGYLDLKRERADFKMTNATIIARSSSNYTSAFIIDKGSFHGVSENMPVINSDGVLLGVVVSADSSSSKCLSLTSYDLKVGVYDEATGGTGILSGDYSLFTDGKCMINGLPSETQVKAGDRILTSGAGDVYPRGLIIGTVESIVPDANSYTLGAVVVPDGTQLEADSVMVITSFEKSYE